MNVIKMNVIKMGVIRLEYIWVGGNSELRSKVKVEYVYDLDKWILNDNIEKIPIWNFDGSSTNQATGHNSEVIIKPCKLYHNSYSKGFDKSYYVICDTYTPEMKPHPTNTRFKADLSFLKNLDEKPLFGIEHEFFVLDEKSKRPLGFELEDPPQQGPYYCSVGCGNAKGRKFLDECLSEAVITGIKVTGSNLEVCPGQMEIQICNYGIDAGDDSLMLKYLLSKIGETHSYIIEWNAKPLKGDWNGSGCHVNFSTEKMRAENGYSEIMNAIWNLSERHQEHIEIYGDDNFNRLTGNHETSDINNFTYGLADRGCSIRIPKSTFMNLKGYFEDRRPSSSCDLYLVTSKIFETSTNNKKIREAILEIVPDMTLTLTNEKIWKFGVKVKSGTLRVGMKVNSSYMNNLEQQEFGYIVSMKLDTKKCSIGHQGTKYSIEIENFKDNNKKIDLENIDNLICN